MTTPARIRPCRTPGCERRTDWPANPETKAAFCRECTAEVMHRGRSTPVA